MVPWLRMDAGLDSHPKFVAAGYEAIEVVPILWRIARLHGKRGVLRRSMTTPSYVAMFARAGCDAIPRFERGIAAAFRERLIDIIDDDHVAVHNWDDYQWDSGAAERQRRHRKVTKASVTRDVTSSHHVARDVTAVTAVTAVTGTPPHPTPPLPHNTGRGYRQPSVDSSGPPVQTSLLANEPPARKEPTKDKTNGMVAMIFAYWQERCGHPRALLDRKRQGRIEWALKNYGEEAARKAIDGCLASSWHQGDNAARKRYDSIGLIFRDAERIEAFIEQRAAPEEPEKEF